MVLFVSDVHLGIGTRAEDRETERSLIAFVEAHAEALEHLVILGDLFHHYVEYRHLVPKGGARLMGCLAALTDAGTPVTYCAGNHDPWHRDYFSQELGVEVLADGAVRWLGGARAYLEHGDARMPRPAWKQRLRGVLRHPLPVWAYRTLLPGDTGAGLARYVSRHHGDGSTPEGDVMALRDAAFARLAESEASGEPLDLVAFGHVHRPILVRAPLPLNLHTPKLPYPSPESEKKRPGPIGPSGEAKRGGLYLNPGAWYASQTAGVLENGALRLVRWPRGATFASHAETLTAFALPAFS